MWDVQDLLGWNPLTGPVPEGLPDPLDQQGHPLSRLALLARSLEWAALVELSGLVQGAAADEADVLDGEEGEESGGNNRALSAECRLLHVLKWLPAFRTCALPFIHFSFLKMQTTSLTLSPHLSIPHPISIQSQGPYLGPAQCRSPREYREQALLAASAVMALSRDGELRIPALLLPHEYFFLREHLPVHLANRDVYLVGRSLDVRDVNEGLSECVNGGG